jgi:homoserine kinase
MDANMSAAEEGFGRGVRIRVPASTSNLGPAFDAVGLALRLYLTLVARELDEGPSRLEIFGEDAQLMPSDASNLVWRTMVDLAAEAGSSLPFLELRVENEIPIAKGLGSSAAARLAAASAVNFFCRLHWGYEQLLELVARREGHPDNAAPSLWGGLVASIGGDRILCSKSKFPPDWTVITVTPDFELETSLARSVLPSQIPREHAIHNVQRAAFLMAQLVQGRREGLREAMSDLLHQPYRGELLPGLKDVLAMEDRDGLLGVALSGAGSTVVALADAHESEIGARICDIFESHGLSSRVRLLKADNTGLTLAPL